MNSHKTQQGFTLIELVVTLLLAGICLLLATRLFVEAYRQYYAYRDRNATFFAEYNNVIRFRTLLKEQSWTCREDGSFSFTGNHLDSTNGTTLFPSALCEKSSKTGRVLICIKPEVCVPH